MYVSSASIAKFQSTPSAWRETHSIPVVAVKAIGFQSTPSAWRETHCGSEKRQNASDFNPLPPHGGRPFAIEIHILPICISIHSLRMEGDENRTLPSGAAAIFQSTPSAWRETVDAKYALIEAAFQSTPSAWRETGNSGETEKGCKDFNPLPPHGGRLYSLRDINKENSFQSTPSAWRETITLGVLGK